MDSATAISIAGGVGTAGVAAITTLWRSTVAVTQRTEKRLVSKLDECEQKHEHAQTQLISLTGRVGLLEGKFQSLEETK